MMFSIVIPVYNASRTISRCLNSILIQSFTDFEVIIVNDGSVDDTQEIIDKISIKNDKVKVINIENSGVSKARNVGIEHSKGLYLIFIDSDDWIEKGYLQYLETNLSNRPCGIILPYYEARGNNLRLINSLHLIKSFEMDFLIGNIKNNPWDKVFKREIFISNNIFFPEGLSVGEDACVTLSLIKSAKIIEVGKLGFLIYQLDSGGVTKSPISQKKIDDILVVSSIIGSKISKSNLKHYSYYNIFLLIGYYIDACNVRGLDYGKLEYKLNESIRAVSFNKIYGVKRNLYIFILKFMVGFKFGRLLRYV